ncbi:MAG: hypothetical protein L6R38_004895 [Xanthoria sp. 2 TBL-2021]|nr:MAG: hypothetical protein L6R38_004895 [Xanthoria sp. 2 TBL-2021]
MMQLLQVITFHRVAMLQVAKIEQGRLPVSTLLKSLRYHVPKLRPLFHRGNFIDHNGISWAPDKATAFKVITLMEDDEVRKSLRLEDLTTEICVLSHEPLKTHPNIIKLLGVAWTQAPTLNGIGARVEKPATPAALLELARHGSLLRFLHRPKNPLSHETKLKLCTDVLLAIQALHACRVAHGDVKAENALVFETGDSSSEPWFAKLGDFGGAVLNVDEVDRRGFVLKQIRGTPLYNPPELDCSSDLTPQHAIAGDIWCWGMLLWRTIIDGEQYSYHSNETLDPRTIDLKQMQTLRKQQDFSSVAVDCARRQMERFGESRPRLRELVYWLLEATLRRDPSNRLDAGQLRDHIVQYDQDRLISHRLLNDYVKYPSPAKQIADYPVLDLLETYQDLSQLSSLPNVVSCELLRQYRSGAATEGQTDKFRQLALQIGFSYLIGFGVPQQPQTALAYVLEASKLGSPSAQAICLRLHSLLQQPINPATCEEWLQHAAMNGSWIADADYRFHFPMRYDDMRFTNMQLLRQSLKQSIERLPIPDHHSISLGKRVASVRFEAKEAIGNLLGVENLGEVSDQTFENALRFVEKSSDLLRTACLNGDLSLANLFLDLGAGLSQGEQGDNAFHWLIGIDDELAPALAKRIRQASAVIDINATTNHAIRLSTEPHYFGTMPAQTTPLLWAIARDRWTLAQALLDLGATTPFSMLNSKRLSGINPITWAIQHRALDCLLGLLEKDFTRRHDYINAIDEHDHPPLFYALIPDWDCRLLCASRGPDSTYAEVEDAILRALISHGRNSAVPLDQSFDHPQAAVISDLKLFGTWSEDVGLADRFFGKEKMRRGERQRTMISEAIIYGRVDIFSYMLTTLQRHEEELQDVEVSSTDSLQTASLTQAILDQQLLHLCVRAPMTAGVRIAQQILDLCPISVNWKDARGRTPLFEALAQDQIPLAELLVDRGADLETRDRDGCTPLGFAVARQSVAGVQYLAGRLERLGRPLTAYPHLEMEDMLHPLWWLRGSWLSTNSAVFGYRSVSCLDYLCTVYAKSDGNRSTLDLDILFPDIDIKLRPWSLKVPPTMAFWRILEILLQVEPRRRGGRPSIWSSPQQRFLSSDTVTSGLWHGVRYLDETYVRKVVRTTKFDPDYRTLLDSACRHGQPRTWWNCDPKPLEERLVLIGKFLEGQFEMDFRRQRDLHLRTGRIWPARMLARLRYSCYADMEMEAYLRWHQWRMKNAPTVMSPLEFSKSQRLAFPFLWFFRALVWSIMLSWMTFVLKIWSDPDIEYKGSNEWTAGNQGVTFVYTIFMVGILTCYLFDTLATT